MLLDLFLKKLLSWHKINVKECVCSIHGNQIDSSFIPKSSSDIFLHFKRYHNNSAKLFECAPHFMSYVRTIVQVSTLCLEQLYDQPGLIGMISTSVLHYFQDKPILCSYDYLQRLTKLGSKTVLLNKVKWLNDSRKHAKAEKKSKAKKKVAILSHD